MLAPDGLLFQRTGTTPATSVILPVGTPAVLVHYAVSSTLRRDVKFTDTGGISAVLTLSPGVEGDTDHAGVQAYHGLTRIDFLGIVDSGIHVTDTDFHVRGLTYVRPSAIDISKALIEHIDVLATSASLTTEQAGALKVKLHAAIAKLEEEKTNTAANQVGAFKNNVAAMVQSGQIAAPVGQQLTNVADQILVVEDGISIIE